MWDFPSPVGWLSGLFAWCAALVVFLGSLLGSSGCSAPAAKGFPAEFSQAAGQITTSIADQAVWEKISANLDGSVIEPGYEGYAGMLYVAGGKIAGFSGHVGASAIGDGSGALTPKAREAILRYLAGDERYREFLLKLVGVIKTANAPQAAAPEAEPQDAAMPTPEEPAQQGADEPVTPPAAEDENPPATEGSFASSAVESMASEANEP